MAGPFALGFLLLGGLLLRHFLALLAGFGKADGDGLLAALHGATFAALAALELAALRRFMVRSTSFEALFEYRAMASLSLSFPVSRPSSRR